MIIYIFCMKYMELPVTAIKGTVIKIDIFKILYCSAFEYFLSKDII